ncbi:MAG: cytidine deaminase [Bacteroidota bacterium]
MKQTLTTEYELFNNATELELEDALLLTEARNNTGLSYAPYSHFHVAAVAQLDNGQLVYGANQENASYPVGICAERTLLSAISSQYPEQSAVAIAISYANENGGSLHPISPCGICRQTLLEYEQRWQHPIKLILGGQEGKIIVLQSAKDIMPFSFSADDMK